jgi:hypothetical protein
MSIPYSDQYELPSATAMKSLCQSSEDHWLFLHASTTLFATLTSALAILFMLPMVLAAPVGMIYGTTFWSGDLIAVEAWIQGALLSAVTVSGVLVLAAVFVRVYTRSQFGAPAFESELQVDLSPEETRKLVRSYLRAKSVDETFEVARSERRQIALMQQGRFSDTYLEVSTISLDEDRTWILFRGASKLHGRAILMSSFFTDFSCSEQGVLKMMKMFKPYASAKKRPVAGYKRSKQAIPLVRIVDHAPPPSMRKKHRYQHECTESDLRHLKACS